MRIEWIEKYLKEAEQLIYESNLEGGLTLMTNLLYEEPGYGSLHNHLGWAYLYYTSDIAKAELHLTLAVKFQEAYPAPYLHLGNLHIRKGDYAKALKVLECGVKKPDANRLAFLENIARAHELMGEYKKAVTTYKAALKASAGPESNGYIESIKRCRKKRLVLFFPF